MLFFPWLYKGFIRHIYRTGSVPLTICWIRQENPNWLFAVWKTGVSSGSWRSKAWRLPRESLVWVFVGRLKSQVLGTWTNWKSVSKGSGEDRSTSEKGKHFLSFSFCPSYKPIGWCCPHWAWVFTQPTDFRIRQPQPRSELTDLLGSYSSCQAHHN